MALLAEERRRRKEAALKNQEYLVAKAHEAVKAVHSSHPTTTTTTTKRSFDDATSGNGAKATSLSALEKLSKGGGGITSADIAAVYGGPKKRRKKGNTGVYVQGLPRHLSETELRIALNRTCERRVGPVRRIKIYHEKGSLGVVKGDALVLFETAADAVKAVAELNGEQLQAGFYMQVSRAQFDTAASSKKTNSDSTTATATNSSTSTATASFAPPQALAAPVVPTPPTPMTTKAISSTVLLYNVFDPTRELNPYLGHISELKGIEKEMYQELQRFGVVKRFDILENGSVLVA